MGKFKEKVNEAINIIESCFDENNEDNLSFDERLDNAIENCEDETIKEILKQSKVAYE